MILKETNDTENYKLNLLYCALFVPVAQLSQSVFSELNSLLTKKDEPVAIHYRNIEIRPLTITKSVHLFYSELLFTEDVPIRIVVVFVETASKTGNQEKNPFNFQRRWTVKRLEKQHESEKVADSKFEQKLREFEAYHARRLTEVEALNQKLLNSITALQEKLTSTPSTKGKGRGKSSSTASTSHSISRDLQGVGLNDLSRSSNQEMLSNDRPESESVPLMSRCNTRSLSAGSRSFESGFVNLGFEHDSDILTETSELYIKKIDLLVNGTSVDQIEDHQTEDECMTMYWRMMEFTGLNQSPFSNGISYEDFRKGYFMAVFDLTTSGHAGSSFLIPSVRMGHVRLNVEFSEAVPINLGINL